MRNIVVGLDGSDSAQRALERAAELAQNGTPVTVVSVPPVTFTSVGPISPGRRRSPATGLCSPRPLNS